MSYFFFVWTCWLQKYNENEEVAALILATCILVILKILTTITYKNSLFFRVKISTKFVFINIFLMGLIIINTQVFFYSVITVIISFNFFYFFFKKLLSKKCVFQRVYENIHWIKLLCNFQYSWKIYANNLSAEYINSEFKQKVWRRKSVIAILLVLTTVLLAYCSLMKPTVVINYSYAGIIISDFYAFIIIFIIPFLHSTISYKYYMKKKFCRIKSIYEISKNFICFVLSLLLEIVIIISIAISHAK